jgi:light-regulated signal transduction histidine kinase (bacteriophytochrome)
MMGSAVETLDRKLLKLVHRSGRIIDTYATAASINFDGRTLIQLELRDVTRERKALANAKMLAETLEARVEERTRELRLANHDLEAANRDLESFSYSVAHDLRAPLRSIVGFSALLGEDLADGQFEEATRHARRMSASALRMNELIDGLLAVARVTHGALADAPVDFNAMARVAAREAEPGATAHITIGPLPTVRGDAASLRQVWTNLISNAVKYSAKRPQPEIAIGCESGETAIVFYVRDNGAGFEPKHAGKLFGVFQRLHTEKEFDGTGVGLAVVRRVVERHGGSIWAEGAPDAGATFYFSLPVTRLVEPAAG